MSEDGPREAGYSALIAGSVLRANGKCVTPLAQTGISRRAEAVAERTAIELT